MLSQHILYKIIKYSSLVDSIKICSIIFKDNIFNSIIKKYDNTHIFKICNSKDYLSINPCKICLNIVCYRCEEYCSYCDNSFDTPPLFSTPHLSLSIVPKVE